MSLLVFNDISEGIVSEKNRYSKDFKVLPIEETHNAFSGAMKPK